MKWRYSNLRLAKFPIAVRSSSNKEECVCILLDGNNNNNNKSHENQGYLSSPSDTIEKIKKGEGEGDGEGIESETGESKDSSANSKKHKVNWTILKTFTNMCESSQKNVSKKNLG